MPRLLAEIACERAVHALDQQEAALNELRGRTGTLLAAEALTTSFLGAAAIQHGALALPGRLAITCFAISLGAALFVLLPWRGNELVIARLYPLFTSSAAALVLELMLWAIALKDVI